jgi:exonuclease III
MIVLTFNVRGLRGRHKKNKIKQLVRNHIIDFLAIQETKMEIITTRFLPSEGNSGRIFIDMEKIYG